MDFIKIKYQLVFTLQEKMFIAIKKTIAITLELL